MSLKPKKSSKIESEKAKQEMVRKQMFLAGESRRKATMRAIAGNLYRELQDVIPNVKYHNLYHPRLFYQTEFDKVVDFGELSLRFERTWRGRAEDGSDDLCRAIVTVPTKIIRPQTTSSGFSRFATKEKTRAEAMKDYKKLQKVIEKEVAKGY